MKRYILLAACLIAINAHGQDTSDDPAHRYYAPTQKKYTFAVQPLQLFNGGWRFDAEMRLGNGPGWLHLSPTVYYRKHDDKEDEPRYAYFENDYNYYNSYYHIDIFVPFSKLLGGGLDAYYKHFLNASRTFYHAAGVSYARFNIDYWGMEWDEYTEDGLPYLAYALDYRSQQINRWGVNILFGCQIPNRSAFLADFFWGLAYRHSFSDKDKPSFNRTMLSYGHTGFVLLTGVRLGIGVK